MGTINGINAKAVSLESPSETSKRKKYFLFGVFFDGTGNNMNDNHSKQQNAKEKFKNINQPQGANELKESYENADGGDYSNIALLHGIYQGMHEEAEKELANNYDVYTFNVYVEGPGTTGKAVDNKVGGTFAGVGTGGVISVVSQAIKFVRQKLDTHDTLLDAEIHFHVFGFSRGAAAARIFSHLALRGSNESLAGIDNYMSVTKYDHISKYIDNGYIHFLDNLKVKSITVDFLGLFDTVSSIGIAYSPNDVNDYGLYLHEGVKGAMHLCALDEFRECFALTDLGKSVDNPNFTEFFIPGCHTDVGGGYTKDTRTLWIEKEPKKIYTVRQEAAFSEPKPININTLKELGWLAKGNILKEVEINDDDTRFQKWQKNAQNKIAHPINSAAGIIEIEREVDRGYNLIPFELMRTKAQQITEKQLFLNIGQQKNGRLSCPKDLEELRKEMVKYVRAFSKGRHFYYPGEAYNSEKYRDIRKQFINYSAIPYCPGLDPSFKEDIMSRKIVHGNKDSKGYNFLCDEPSVK